MGLRTMNYRANMIGATFEIKPNQKNGTIVTCVLPLKTPAKHGRNGSNGTNGSNGAHTGSSSNGTVPMKCAADPEKVLA